MHSTALDPLADRWFLGTFMHFHVTKEASGGRFTLTEQVAPRGFSPPRHVHAHEDGMIYVVEGSLTVLVGDDVRAVAAGQAVFLPRGVPHTFRVDSERVRLLEIASPGGVETFYRACGSPADAPFLPPASSAPPDVGRLTDEAARLDIQIVGPPLT